MILSESLSARRKVQNAASRRYDGSHNSMEEVVDEAHRGFYPNEDHPNRERTRILCLE
jgi:hypothetical protein